MQTVKNGNIVCPSILRRNILTLALDNIDHNPSSTMAKGPLYGTAISITQQPTEANPAGTELPINFNLQLKSDAITLSNDYSIVPAIDSKFTSVEIPLVNRHCKERKEQLETPVHEEQDWFKIIFPIDDNH